MSNRLLRVLVPAVLFLAAGCGPGVCPVEGRVQYPDGSAATGLFGGVVSFESADAKVAAQGPIRADGTFTLTGLAGGNGLPPGEYRVAVRAHPSAAGQHPIAPHFQSVETSGLTETVKPGKNAVTLTVQRGP